MKRTFQLLYILSAIIYLIALSYDKNVIMSITKPIPLLLLIFLVRKNSPYNYLITFGLLFSLIGDILLMKTVNLFLYGLIAFLIAHVFYIVAFFQKSNKPLILSSLPFYLYGIVFFIFIIKGLGEMAIPVAFYMFIITTMLWRSFAQRNATSLAKLAFIGALLFTVSDSMIAISKFQETFFLDGLFIMFSYWTAQYFIYKSTQKSSANDS